MAIRRTDEKYTNLSAAQYNGSARPGELVIDLTTFEVFVGDNNGNLLPIGGGGGNLANAIIGNLVVTDSANLGQVGNITILGGNPGDVLTTDGTGNLSWAPSGGGGGYGNSNVSLYLDGNINTNIVPLANSIQTLGNVTNQWREVWTDDIYLDSVPLTVSNTSGVPQLNFNGVPILVSSGTEDIITSGNGQFNQLAVNSITAATGNFGQIIGDGSGITGVLEANYANYAGNVVFSNQPNITQIGTLINLGVAGNAAVGGNLAVTDNFTVGTSLAYDTANSVLTIAGTANVNRLDTDTITGVSPVIQATGVNGGITLQPSGTGNVSVSGAYVTNVQNPLNPQDAATKAYVDAIATGLNIKPSVNLATDASLSLPYTYNNGTAGVGAQLFFTMPNGDPLVIEGQPALSGYRVLIKNETGPFVDNTTPSAAFNGIYGVSYSSTSVGGVITYFAILTRTTDLDESNEFPSAFVFDEFSGNGWVCTNTEPPSVVVGTTEITWTQFSRAGQYTAGVALSQVGTAFNVNTDGVTVAVNSSNQLEIPVNAQLRAPNIGNATGSNLTLTGNIGAANATVTGTLTASESNLGPIGNITVLGGTAGQVITTDGVGNLSFVTIPAGYSNADVSLYLDGNIPTNIVPLGNNTQNLGSPANQWNNMWVGGTGTFVNINAANVTATNRISGDGGGISNIAGPNVVGQVSFAAVANSVAGANVSGAVANANYAAYAGNITIAAQPNITQVGTLVDLSVAGNLSVGTRFAIDSANGQLSLVGVATVNQLNTESVTGASPTITATGVNGGISLQTQGTGNINVNNTNIVNLKDPVNPQDAVTKAYADAIATGVTPKQSVNLATDAPLSLPYTYSNGTSGVGARLFFTMPDADPLIIEGQPALPGYRVLVKNETGPFVDNSTPSAAFNGIYVVSYGATSLGGVTSYFARLTRASDFNQSSEVPAALVFDEYSGDSWLCTTVEPPSVVIGTTQILWTQFSRAGQYTAGSGLQLAGSQFSTLTDGVTVTVNASNQLSVPPNAQFVTPNIGDATGSNLVVTGNIGAGNITTTGLLTASESNLGPVGNVTITGGSVGQVLTTDGTGNLSWSTGSGGGTVTAIPAVYFTAPVTGNNQTFSNTFLSSYQSNTDITLFYNGSLLEHGFYTLSGDTLTVNTVVYAGDSIDVIQTAAANVIQITGTYGNSNVTTLLSSGNITGNVNFGNAITNVGSNANIRIGGGTVGQVLTTDGTGNLSWSAGGGGSVISIPSVYFTATATGNNQSFSNPILSQYSANTDMTVFYNGTLLEDGFYTLSGDTITVNTILYPGDSVDITRQFATATVPSYQAIPAIYFTATATGNNQTFSNVFLSQYGSASDLTVFYNGALLENGFYTLSGDTLTVNTVLATGDSIDIIRQLAGNVGTVGVYGDSNVLAYLSGGTYAGDIIPAGNSVYSLGNTTNQWRDLYLSGNTLFINNIPLSINSNTDLLVNGNPVVTTTGANGLVNANALQVVGPVEANSVTVTGDITTTSGFFRGNGAFLTGLPSAYTDANVAAFMPTYLPTYSGNLGAGNITATGNVSGNQLISGTNGIRLSGNTLSTANSVMTIDPLGDGSALTGNVSVLGNLSVAGTLTFNNSNITSTNNLVWQAANNATTQAAAAGGGLSVGPGATPYATWTYNPTTPEWVSNIAIRATGGVNVGGPLSGATTGAFTGVITAQSFAGDGGNLSNISGANVTGTVGNAVFAINSTQANQANTATSATFATISEQANTANTATFATLSGSANTANTATLAATATFANTANSVAGANVSGQVANALVSGTVYTAAQPNITSVGTLTGLDVAGNIIATANVQAGYFIGDGSQLTGLQSGYTNANVADYLASDTITTDIITTGNSSVGNLTVSGQTSLGFAGNVLITGGNVGQVLGATGTGNLVWVDSPLYFVPPVYITVPVDGNNQTFSNTILASYTSNTQMTVFYNGSLLENQYYTLSGDEITVNIPLEAGDGIDVITTISGNVNSIVSSGYGNSNVAAYLPSYTGALDSLTGPVVTTGVVTGTTLSAGAGNLQLSGTVLSATDDTITIDPLGDGGPGGNVIISGNLQVTGNLTYNDVVNATTNDLQWVAANNAINQAAASGAGLAVGPSGAYASFIYNSGTNSWQSSLPIIANGGVNANGALSGATTGSFTGNVTASYFIGNGSQLTGLPASYTDANVAAYLPTYTGNITAGNITATGNITADNIGNVAAIDLNGNGSTYLTGTGIWAAGGGGSSGMRNITKVDQIYGYGTSFILADGRLFIAKGAGSSQAFCAALGQNNTNIQAGINNLYEVSFSQEDTGTIVDAGQYGPSAYALFQNGNLYTWGYNGYGQLGLGNVTDSPLPTLSNTNVAQVYVTKAQNTQYLIQRIVIRKTDNTYWGCGHDGQYQFGLGTNNIKTSWTALPWILATTLSVWVLGGDLGNIVIQKADGTITVTGFNGSGQLGINSTLTPTFPVDAPLWLGGDNTMRIKQIGWGGSYRTNNGTVFTATGMTMLLDNGTTSRLVGAGANSWGALATGNLTNSSVPVEPLTSSGLTGRITKIGSCGNAIRTMYALLEDGTLFSWGYNGYGAVGNGGNSTVTTPYQLATDVLDIMGEIQGWTNNGYFSPSPYIRKADGYYACGYNGFANLGDGTNSNRSSLVKLRVAKGVEFKFFATYGFNDGLTRLGITTDNKIWAWGYNSLGAVDPTTLTWQAQVPIAFTPNALRT